jgi:hypothetical protein
MHFDNKWDNHKYWQQYFDIQLKLIEVKIYQLFL